MSDTLASFIFYFLPMLFVSCSNVILYILTVASINHISSITNSGHLLSLDSLIFRLSKAFEFVTFFLSVTHRDRGRSDLFIYLRIFVVLGITWVFGILVLFAKDGSDIEKVLILCYVVTDSLQVMSEWSLFMYNELQQGFFLFWIFTFNRRVLELYARLFAKIKENYALRREIQTRLKPKRRLIRQQIMEENINRVLVLHS